MTSILYITIKYDKYTLIFSLFKKKQINSEMNKKNIVPSYCASRKISTKYNKDMTITN